MGNITKSISNKGTPLIQFFTFVYEYFLLRKALEESGFLTHSLIAVSVVNV